MYEKQALVLVNRGGAHGAEVIALARAVQAAVRERFGVELTPEPVFERSERIGATTARGVNVVGQRHGFPWHKSHQNGLVSSEHLTRAQEAPLTERQIAESDRPDAHALEAGHAQPDQLAHPPDLSLSAPHAQNEAKLIVVEPLDPGRLQLALVEAAARA
jgi:hypothetical protein